MCIICEKNAYKKFGEAIDLLMNARFCPTAKRKCLYSRVTSVAKVVFPFNRRVFKNNTESNEPEMVFLSFSIIFSLRFMFLYYIYLILK